MSESVNENSNQLNDNEMDLNESIKVRREKLKNLGDAGKNPYYETVFNKTHLSNKIFDEYSSLEGQDVSIAGRIVSRRIMGKASFCHILDAGGKMQIYLKADEMGEVYEEFKSWDIGDIVGVQGKVFTTRMGEVSLHVKEIKLLAKSLLPLPEKYHGLSDPDLRYRRRYVDLIANPDVKNTFVLRSKIISAVREYLERDGYLEVETPILNTLAGGAEARPFITHHNTLDIDLYLRIAPELYLKRLIVGGFERVYELGRMFRNEGMSTRHNPEFTMMELYAAYGDYNTMMETAERLVEYVAQKTLGSTEVSYQGTPISFKAPWKRITMAEAVKEYAGVDADKLTGSELLEVFEERVEPKLIQPTFVTEYPVEVSPLAKAKRADSSLTERFEIFVYGRELGNAYSELNDPIVQKQRFMAQAKKREKGDETAMPVDDDFVTALEYGMPPTGGLGIGIDRLVMFLTDSASIRDVLLFPTMKPI